MASETISSCIPLSIFSSCSAGLWRLTGCRPMWGGQVHGRRCVLHGRRRSVQASTRSSPPLLPLLPHTKTDVRHTSLSTSGSPSASSSACAALPTRRSLSTAPSTTRRQAAERPPSLRTRFRPCPNRACTRSRQRSTRPTSCSRRMRMSTGSITLS